jgi:hypothetical protein
LGARAVYSNVLIEGSLDTTGVEGFFYFGPRRKEGAGLLNDQNTAKIKLKKNRVSYFVHVFFKT